MMKDKSNLTLPRIDYGEMTKASPPSYEKYLPPPPLGIDDFIENSCGELNHTLLNDYLFRALLQENNEVLKCLICSVLHLEKEEVLTATITNPILLGRHLEQKTFILDVNVSMNDNTMINLELQVANLYNWPERSLGYLCRTYDNLNKGSDYLATKLTIQISFLNYTLFEEHPEFHAVYKLLNVKNYSIYTDKFQLHVIDLTHKDLILEEDKRFKLDLWTSFFTAHTWEEIKMLTKDHPEIHSAAKTIYQLDNDSTVQWLCQREQDSLNHVKAMKNLIAERDSALAEKDIALAEKDSTIAEKDSAIANLTYTLAGKDSAIEQLLEEIRHLKQQLSAK